MTVTPENARMDGHGKTTIETCRNRLLLVAVLFLIAFGLIAFRLIDVSLFSATDRRPEIAQAEATPPPAARAGIVDRNGVLLATSVGSASLSADPRQVPDPGEVARRLATVLPDLDVELVKHRLRTKRGFVWLRRHLTPRQHYLVNRLGIPGLDFREEARRMYPQGALTGHVVGFTDIDGRGLAGIEGYFDDTLESGGDSLVLSIDVRAQYALATELQRTVEKFDATGAAGLVMNVHTAEVIAMVSLPGFNPNMPPVGDTERRFNRTTLGVFEMGSMFKIFSTALALQTGVATMDGRYDATRPLRVARFVIRDHHARNRWLSVPEIFAYSSNIGTVRMMREVGPEKHLSFLAELGMLRPVRLELSEIGVPLSPARWRNISSITASYGYGVAVTPIHVAAGVSAMVNGGIYRDPTLLRRDSAHAGRRVVSATTSDQMRSLLRLVVEKGTGRKAGHSGYFVGGKTGTTEKVSDRRYERSALISSFVGAFPIDAPEYVVLIMFDEPKGIAETQGYATGGWVAAPAAKAVIERIAPVLGVAPVADRGDGPDRRASGPRSRERQVASR